MTEEWRPVPGFDGWYDVSDQGQLRSWRPHMGLPLPRLLTPSIAKNGYRLTSLRKGGANKSCYIHHLVPLAFVGPKPAGMHVRHLNGDRLDNRLSNLRYGTPSENVQDSLRHGTNASVNKTHCPSGHEYSDENTYRHPDGRRFCRTCARAKNSRRVSCTECGMEIAAGRRAAHRRVHHSGRKPGRVYVRGPIPHGTDNGYTMHCNRREPVPPGDPCGCRAAHAAKEAERKRRRTAA